MGPSKGRERASPRHLEGNYRVMHDAVSSIYNTFEIDYEGYILERVSTFQCSSVVIYSRNTFGRSFLPIQFLHLLTLSLLHCLPVF